VLFSHDPTLGGNVVGLVGEIGFGSCGGGVSVFPDDAGDWVVVVVEGDLVYEEVWVGWGVMVG
jgi:hypothetical protein